MDYKLAKGDIAKDYNGEKWKVMVESKNRTKTVLSYDESGALTDAPLDEIEGFRFAGCIGVDKDNDGERVAWAYTTATSLRKIVLGQ